MYRVVTLVHLSRQPGHVNQVVVATTNSSTWLDNQEGHMDSRF